MAWERPSSRVAELMRQGAALMLEARELVLDEMDLTTLHAIDPSIAADPVLAAAIRRSARANLTYWAEASLRDPGGEVRANVGPEQLEIARDVVRRGMGEDVLQSYRTGQNGAWRQWMKIALSLTSDPGEIGELLDVSARSIFGFVDATIARIAAQIQAERDDLTRGTHAERLEIVALIIDGAPIARRRAAVRLGYELDQTHTAAVVWTDDPEPDVAALEQASEALAKAANARRPFNVIASAAALWVWVAGDSGPDLPQLAVAVDRLDGIRIAIGPTAAGVDGFRRSHLDALATQRLLSRTSSRLRLATYKSVQLAALVTQDPERADEFVRQTLGEFERASPELRATVRTFLREHSNASRAAKLLHTHRNTVLGRLARADRLLPQPLDQTGLEVALALEVVHWRGDDQR